MLPHAMLVSPGTHATVISCVPNVVVSPIFHRARRRDRRPDFERTATRRYALGARFRRAAASEAAHDCIGVRRFSRKNA